MTTETRPKTYKLIIPLLVISAIAFSVAEIALWGAEDRRQRNIRKFYHNFKVDTVRDVHGAVDMEQSGVFVPLKKLDSMRLILQKD